MSKVIAITEKSDLESIIAEGGHVVIKFTAPAWCRPCQQFAPHFVKAAEYADHQSGVSGPVKFVSIDIDNAPWATVDYGVRGVPTVMLYRDGQYVKNLQERTVVKLISEIYA